MFVSKKKYDDLLALYQLLSVDLEEWREECLNLRDELDALKASRARSNENLKLGTAASAKARRKKALPAEKGKFDFSRPVIAFHVDGREIKVTDLEYDGGNDAWSRQIPDRDCETYFCHLDGVAHGTGWALRYA